MPGAHATVSTVNASREGGTGRTQPLTREALVAATVHIADADGAAAVTMRRIGAELGVDPSAAYRHVKDKDELLGAAADWLISTALDGVELTGDFATDLRAIGLQARRNYLRHPALVTLVTTAPGPFKSEAAVTEVVLGVLRSGGLSLHDAALAFEVLQDYVLGFTLLDAVEDAEVAEPWHEAFGDLPPETFPLLAEAGQLLYGDPEARFLHGLDLLIESLDRRRGAR